MYRLDNSLIVTHGQDLNSETARVTLIQSAKYRLESVRNFDFETKNKVTYPLIGLVVKVDAAASPSAVSYDVEGGYEKYKFGSELDAKCKGNGNFEIEFELEALGKSLEFDAKRTVISNDKSKLEAVLELKPGGKYQLVTDLTHIFKQNDVNLQVDALLKLAGRPEDIKGSTAVIVNKELLELFAKLSSGSNEYLDIDWKLNRAVGKPSGDIKLSVCYEPPASAPNPSALTLSLQVFLKGLVEANAQYKYVSGKGSATLNIDLPKQGRKIKGTGDLAVTGSNHVASVDLYWDADKDSKKSLHFETNSDITKNSLDSKYVTVHCSNSTMFTESCEKNSLVVLQQKTTLNVKGTLKGKLMDGHLVGQADLTLPKSRQLTVKLDRTLHLSRGSVELDGKLELVAKENAASSGNLLSLETKVKAEEANQLLDSLVRIALKTSKGKDLSASVVVKNTPQREQRLLEASAQVESSYFKTLTAQVSAEVSQTHITYKGHAAQGPETALDVSGRFDRGHDGKVLLRVDNTFALAFGLDNTIQITLPLEKIKTLKLTTSVNVDADNNNAVLKTDNALTLNGAETYKFGGEANRQKEKGTAKLVLILPKEQPRTLSTSWHVNDENGEIFHSDSTTRAGLCSETFHSDSTTCAGLCSETFHSNSTTCAGLCSETFYSASTICAGLCSEILHSDSTTCAGLCSETFHSDSTICAGLCSEIFHSDSTTCAGLCSETFHSNSTICAGLCSETFHSDNTICAGLCSETLHSDSTTCAGLCSETFHSDSTICAGLCSETFHSDSTICAVLCKVYKRGGSASLQWAGNQNAEITVEALVPKDRSGMEVRLTANTPKLGNVELTLQNKVSHVVGARSAATALLAIVNGKKYDFKGKVSEGSFKYLPNVDLTAVHPKGTSRLYLNLKRVSDTEFAGDSELQYTLNGGGKLTLSGESKIESLEDFSIKVDADSEALKLNKWHIVIERKPSKNKKNLQISATSAGKNVLAGRLDFHHSNKGSLSHWEVGGNVKLVDKNQDLKVALDIVELKKDTAGEIGLQTTLNAVLGERSFTGVQKFSNKELHLGSTLCLKQGQCSQVDLQSKLTIVDASEISHHLILLVDLKTLGVPEKLQVKSSTVRTGFLLMDHNVEVELHSDSVVTYKARIYLQEHEAGELTCYLQEGKAGDSTW
uniref:Uncharacterized protein n=1 Tax=Timema tahoe TaxID=61484 RepID=A0A7R9FJD3_9NEOP|nr:unnamed protein product [Timema tahoe]